MKSTLTICVCFIASGVAVRGQTKTLPPVCQLKADEIKKATPAMRDTEIANFLQVNGADLTCFAQFAALYFERTDPAALKKSAMVFATLVKSLDSSRTDKQAGSSTGTGGTTNLVSKGVTAQVLSIASEYGALTESVNNQTVTVQGSLNAVPAALIRKSVFPYCPGNIPNLQNCVSPALLDALRRFSYGVSFNTSQNAQTVTAQPAGQQTGTAQPVTFTASQNQISAVTGKLILWSKRDAVSDTFQKTWLNALTCASQSPAPANATPANAASTKPASSKPATANACPASATPSASAKAPPAKTTPASSAPATPTVPPSFQTAMQNLIKAPSVAALANQDAWVMVYNNYFGTLQKTTDPTKLDSTLYDYLDAVMDLVKSNKQTPAEVTQFFDALSAYRFEEDDFVASIAEKPVLTFEYDNNRPVGQASNSVFRLIFDDSLGKSAHWSITVNAAVAINDSTQPAAIPGASSFRDAQAAAQIQYNIPALKSMGGAVSGAYYFQYQHSPVIVNVTAASPLTGITFTGLPTNVNQVFTTPGTIHIAQLKFAIGAGQSNVRFPIAFSYSNRTELVPKPEWRGQIGVSYDLDSLFAQ